MSIFKLPSVTATFDSSTVQINTSDSVFGAVPGSLVQIGNRQAVFLERVDTTAQTITLTEPWPYGASTNVECTIAPITSVSSLLTALEHAKALNDAVLQRSMSGGMLLYQSLDELQSACESGAVPIDKVCETTSFWADENTGGNRYILKDAGSSGARPANSVGTNIHIGSEGLYLLALFPDSKYKITQFGGGRGNQSEDSAAIQNMVDAGLTHCFFDDNENEYEILGLTVPHRREFKLIGNSRDKCRIAVRGKVATYGDINITTDFCCHMRDLTFVIYADVTEGVIELRFCRNFVISDVFVTDNDSSTRIGHFLHLNKSYQCKLADIYGRWYGGALFELGASSGNEVLDTITMSNTVWHGNYGMFMRPGPVNIHNLVFDNAKWRDKRGSLEHTNANQGETSIAIDASAGDEIITVYDASQLRQGNLSVNNLLYIGFDKTAEQVRVASASGNQITLDTPLRFAHSASAYVDENGNSFGEPVIFGPVFITLGFSYSTVIKAIHLEAGYIGIHATNMRGASIANAYSTCKKTFRLLNKSRSIQISAVTMGNKQWGDVDLFDIPEYHNPDLNNFDICLNSEVHFDVGVTVNHVNNRSQQNDTSQLNYNVDNTEIVTRSLTTVATPKHSQTYFITMTGRIDTMRVLDGVMPGQRLKLHFLQDANGHRRIVAWTQNVTLREPFFLSSRAHAQDSIELHWDGSAWLEHYRLVSDQAYLPPEKSKGLLANINNELNLYNKYKGKRVITPEGQILTAENWWQGADWVGANGETVVKPGDPLPQPDLSQDVISLSVSASFSLGFGVFKASHLSNLVTVLINVTSAGTKLLTGIPAGNFTGQRLCIVNLQSSSADINLRSTISTITLASDFPYSPGGSVTLIWDGSSWQLIEYSLSNIGEPNENP